MSMLRLSWSENGATRGIAPARREFEVSEGFWVAVLIIVLVAVYVLGKVVHYHRLSQRQWQQVDKSKLKSWDDDEDW